MATDVSDNIVERGLTVVEAMNSERKVAATGLHADPSRMEVLLGAILETLIAIRQDVDRIERHLSGNESP